MKRNKKGFGLVMAIMIIVVLSIMAVGFFVVTDYSTKSTIRNAERLRLYWAAESASNFNVNWWVNQEKDVRVFWNTGYNTESKTTYSDINNYVATEDKFPNAIGTSKLKKYYLHASTITEFGLNPKVGKYDIITSRYKSERKPRSGEVFPAGKEEAVWILDSYAYDPQTGQIANITLTNVYNTDMNLGILNNSEAIVYSFVNSGFNGKLSLFSDKDIRYGQAYYGSMIRTDPSPGSSVLNKFYKGPVLSAAFKKGGDIEARSRWGNWLNPSSVSSTTTPYRYGLGNTEGYKFESQFLASMSTIMNNGLTPYAGNADVENTTDITWTWSDVVSDGVDNGLYMLPSGGTGDVTINLKYDSAADVTTADINGESKIVGPDFTGVGVPAGYGVVNIQGVSNQDFTVVTEASQVNITGNLYISQLQGALDNLDMDIINNTSSYTETELQKLYDALNQMDPSTPKLGIISSLALSGADQWLDVPPITFDSGINIFCSAAMVTNNGSLEGNKHSATGKFVNVGSMVTLNEQSKEQGGTASHAYIKALVQDPRYLKEGVTYPGFYGPGPSSGQAISGLNRQNVWSRQSIQKTDDWNRVVWRPIGGYKPQF